MLLELITNCVAEEIQRFKLIRMLFQLLPNYSAEQVQKRRLFQFLFQLLPKSPAEQGQNIKSFTDSSFNFYIILLQKYRELCCFEGSLFTTKFCIGRNTEN
jgi:hypothetical protein